METLTLQSISLDKLHRLASDNGFSFVSYRTPGADGPVTLLQWQHNPVTIHSLSQLEKLSGFVFAPFDFDSGLPVRLIQPDLIIRGDSFIETHHEYTPLLNQTQVVPEIAERKNHVSSKQDFVQQVEQAQKIIAEHTIEKVVVSRISREEKPETFESASFFHALERAYPDAFVFALYIPDTGLWFGASPEPLLVADDGYVSTVSLAGTRKAMPALQKLPWGDKEIDEQEIVTQYIDGLLKKYNIADIQKAGPVSHVAGKIEHLKTTFSFPQQQLKGKLSEFLSELHPTPSVCGLPKDIAMEVIRKIEKHQREYYSGFLGPVNLDGQWNLFVNLRSMKTLHNHLEYYLGAGITKGSRASDEWEETTNKMNTLKSIVESLRQK